MNITHTQVAGRNVLALGGRFDAHEVDGFRQVLDQVVDGGDVDIAVDLGEVNFIDSSALAELVRGMKHARERGGDLVLRSPSDPVRVIFELTGLDRAFVVDGVA